MTISLTSVAMFLAAGWPFQSDPIAAASDARGGLEKLRATGTVHVTGVLRMEATTDAMDFEAYVAASPQGARGFLAFRNGHAFRATLLSGIKGWERDESGAYRALEGMELRNLQGEVTTLLLASRFPADGRWETAGDKRVRRSTDGVEVEIGRDGRPKSMLVPGASPDSRALSAWREFDGIGFPTRIESVGPPRWTIEITAWQAHAFVVSSLFEPPSSAGDPGVVIGDGMAHVPALQAFVRSRTPSPSRIESIKHPFRVESFTTVAEALKQAALSGPGWFAARLDERGRCVAWEVPRNLGATDSRPTVDDGMATIWSVSIVLPESFDRAQLERALDGIRSLAFDRGLALESFASLHWTVDTQEIGSRPANRRILELARRIVTASK